MTDHPPARAPAILLAATIAMLVVFPGLPAAAHKQHRVGDISTTIGWLEEPAFAGLQNAVQVTVTKGGEPVEGSRLRVQVVFGGKEGEETTPLLDLLPEFGSPGDYRAALIPTRPGVYTFHVVGKLEPGARINHFVTSGAKTFDDVVDAAEAQFPAQDPSTGELSQKLDRLTARIGDAQSAAEAAAAAARDAADAADDTARLLAIVGVALGALALIAVAIRRRPRLA